MRVVLLKNVSGLGLKWEVRTVADGFARNVLIPKRQAAVATSEMLARAESAVAVQQSAEDKVDAGRSDKKHALAGMSIKMSAKANEAGDLYAAISTAAIVRELKKRKVIVSTKAIKGHDPIKSLGEHQLLADLGGGLQANFTVIVEAE